MVSKRNLYVQGIPKVPKGPKYPEGAHFNESGHSEANANETNLEKIMSEAISFRKERESYQWG